MSISGKADSSVIAAVDAFLDDLALGRSPRTIATYRAALRRFLAYLEVYVVSPETLPVGKLSVDYVVDFTRWLGRSGPSLPKRTLFTYTTAVVRFYAFLVREECAPSLPLAQLQLRLRSLRGRQPAALPRVPATEAIEAILAAARAVPPGPDDRLECLRLRNVALIEVLRGSGLRVSEVVALRRGDLNAAERTAVVTGKGGKPRLVYFTAAAWRALEDYFAA
ncbi:MAG TPA: tyrosine-type recombinase/integrase, partial [Dehalococcoidia bacterium]|nr:tyrosine-type recombinase/integrase [Dehalococcoidia bacterium]